MFNVESVKWICIIVVVLALLSELAFGLLAIWTKDSWFPTAECALTAGLFLLVGVGGLAILKLLL